MTENYKREITMASIWMLFIAIVIFYLLEK